VLGRSLIKRWRELVALCENFAMRKFFFRPSYICRALKPFAQRPPALAHWTAGWPWLPLS